MIVDIKRVVFKFNVGIVQKIPISTTIQTAQKCQCEIAHSEVRSYEKLQCHLRRISIQSVGGNEFPVSI